MNYWFPPSVSSYGNQVDHLFVVILWITGIIFFLVEGALLYFLIHYRYREDRRAGYVHSHTGIEIVWTVVPALIVIYLAFASQRI